MEITYHHIDQQEFAAFFQQARSKIFHADFDFEVDKLLDEKAVELKQKNSSLLQGVHRYFLVAKVGTAIAGWSFGYQKTAEDFYMTNSAVFPEFRRMGIYSTLLQMAVKHITDLGFQRVYSRHVMDNNSVLIPKLKFGFVISGFEVTDRFGCLVELSYYTHPKRRELLKTRMGSRKPTQEDLDLIP